MMPYITIVILGGGFCIFRYNEGEITVERVRNERNDCCSKDAREIFESLVATAEY